MKLIKQSFEILPQAPGLEGVYKQIELAGRTCYKSHDKMTENSAKEFVDRMINSNHLAMCEHGTIYLQYKGFALDNPLDKYINNPYSIVKVKYLHSPLNFPKGQTPTPTYYVTTNLRILIENNWIEDYNYIVEPTEYHEKRVTVKFVTDQGILREFTRHRKFSFAVESTRYCNYNSDKFNREITFIEPCWYKEDIPSSYFIDALKYAEDKYIQAMDNGWKAQQARNILPLATKCEMIMTGFVSDWKHFFSLRADGTTGKPHPQAEELAKALKEEFKKLGYE